MRKGLQEAVEEKHQPWPRTWAEQEAPISGKKKFPLHPGHSKVPHHHRISPEISYPTSINL